MQRKNSISSKISPSPSMSRRVTSRPSAMPSPAYHHGKPTGPSVKPPSPRVHRRIDVTNTAKTSLHLPVAGTTGSSRYNHATSEHISSRHTNPSSSDSSSKKVTSHDHTTAAILSQAPPKYTYPTTDSHTLRLSRSESQRDSHKERAGFGSSGSYGSEQNSNPRQRRREEKRKDFVSVESRKEPREIIGLPPVSSTTSGVSLRCSNSTDKSSVADCLNQTGVGSISTHNNELTCKTSQDVNEKMATHFNKLSMKEKGVAGRKTLSQPSSSSSSQATTSQPTTANTTSSQATSQAATSRATAQAQTDKDVFLANRKLSPKKKLYKLLHISRKSESKGVITFCYYLFLLPLSHCLNH